MAHYVAAHNVLLPNDVGPSPTKQPTHPVDPLEFERNLDTAELVIDEQRWVSPGNHSNVPPRVSAGPATKSRQILVRRGARRPSWHQPPAHKSAYGDRWRPGPKTASCPS
ncbi:hypothetical protein Afe04nite_20550 [Asanoa ferruginea]|nr:hypothetical protein Afe04nite_20550 [Asanoa ferruginea]